MEQICPPPITFYLDKLVVILSIIEKGAVGNRLKWDSSLLVNSKSFLNTYTSALIALFSCIIDIYLVDNIGNISYISSGRVFLKSSIWFAQPDLIFPILLLFCQLSNSFCISSNTAWYLVDSGQIFKPANMVRSLARQEIWVISSSERAETNRLFLRDCGFLRQVDLTSKSCQ